MSDFKTTQGYMTVALLVDGIMAKRGHCEVRLEELRKKRFYQASQRADEPVAPTRWWKDRTWRGLSLEECVDRWNRKVSICPRAEMPWAGDDYLGFESTDPWRDVIESDIRRCNRMLKTAARMPGEDARILCDLDVWQWLTVTDMPGPVSVAS